MVCFRYSMMLLLILLALKQSEVISAPSASSVGSLKCMNWRVALVFLILCA
jgi:hypothetical protein